jgi:histidine triad (HIT) family protein
VWHFHVHVMPRWPEDGVYGAARVPLALEQRLELARVLRD